MAEMVSNPQQRPYRWGRFQGWTVVFFGVVQIVTMVSVFYWPENPYANGYFKSSGPRLLDDLRREAATADYAVFAGFVIGYALLEWPPISSQIHQNTIGLPIEQGGDVSPNS